MQSAVNQSAVISNWKIIYNDMDLETEMEKQFHQQKVDLKQNYYQLELQLMSIGIAMTSVTEIEKNPNGKKPEYVTVWKGYRMAHLQDSVNGLFRFMKKNIKSFDFFESNYLKGKSVNCMNIYQKYEFSRMLAFLDKFVDFTSKRIFKYYQDHKYFDQEKSAQTRLEIPTFGNFKCLMLRISTIQDQAKELEEKIMEYNEIQNGKFQCNDKEFIKIWRQFQDSQVVLSSVLKPFLEKKLASNKNANDSNQTNLESSNLEKSTFICEGCNSKRCNCLKNRCYQKSRQDREDKQLERENKDELQIRFNGNDLQIVNQNKRVRSRSPKKSVQVELKLTFDIEIQNSNIVSFKVRKSKGEIQNDSDSEIQNNNIVSSKVRYGKKEIEIESDSQIQNSNVSVKVKQDKEKSDSESEIQDHQYLIEDKYLSSCENTNNSQ